MSDTTLATAVERHLPSALNWLERMVNVNSWTHNREGVNRLGKLTAECFASLGFTAEFVPSANPKWGDHLVLTRRGQGARSVAMISHLDTVFPPEEEARNDFRWRPEGDRIYGPGTNDIKGGTAMMWLSLAVLHELSPAQFEATSWQLLLNSSEEDYSPDFGQLCRARFLPGTLAALVFESEGRLGRQPLLVSARKGRATWRVTVKGRGAHAGAQHERGANAIVQLARTLREVNDLTDYPRGLTLNVGRIEGGTVLNRVPHEAVAEGELRAFDPVVFEGAKQALLALAGPGEVQSIRDRHAGEIEVKFLTESRPWPRNPGTDHLIAVWQQAGRELGVDVGPHERGGLSDGNMIWDAVPTVDGLGPWGDNSHCSERSADGSKEPEYVELSGFGPKAMLNVRGLQLLLAAQT